MATVAGQAAAEQKRQSVPALYVYGVVRAGASGLALGAGVGDATVGTVELGPLAALVSPLPLDGLRLRRRELRRHLEVLERAVAQTTIVPCRFGIVLEDEEAVRSELLGARAEALARALERLDGRSQLNVRIVYDEPSVLREIVAGVPEVARLRAVAQELGEAGHFARIRLGELVAQSLAARREQDAERLLARLEREADDVAVEESDGLVVLKASFLVADPARLDRALDELAREEAPRLRFESIGPLPPTAFATLEGESAWA
jgi:hypothetical protein